MLILFGGMRKPNEDSKRGGSIPCESKSSHFVNVVQRRRELAEVTKPATSASMAIPNDSGRTQFCRLALQIEAASTYRHSRRVAFAQNPAGSAKFAGKGERVVSDLSHQESLLHAYAMIQPGIVWPPSFHRFTWLRPFSTAELLKRLPTRGRIKQTIGVDLENLGG